MSPPATLQRNTHTSYTCAHPQNTWCLSSPCMRWAAFRRMSARTLYTRNEHARTALVWGPERTYW